MGSDERLEISIEIVNGGEDAYEAYFFMYLPESINFIKTELNPDNEDRVSGTPPLLCSPPTLHNEHVLKCEMGNPMAANSAVNI